MTKKEAKQLENAQRDAVEAMRKGDQSALDKASDKAVKAFAKIVNKK
jgi:hypothetical protein